MNRDTLMAALETYSRPRMLEDAIFEYDGERGRTFVMGNEAVELAIKYIHKLEDLTQFLTLEPHEKVAVLEGLTVQLYRARHEIAKLEERNRAHVNEIARLMKVGSTAPIGKSY